MANPVSTISHVVIRCTEKVLAFLDPAARRSLTTEDRDENDWYANVLSIDRRKCMLITHAGTLFSALAPDVSVADIRNIGRFVVDLMEHELGAEGFSMRTFGELGQEPIALAKTADRSVLGCMNDMALLCEVTTEDAGGLHRCDIAQLNYQLRRNIFRARGYVPSIELVASWADRVRPFRQI